MQTHEEGGTPETPKGGMNKSQGTQGRQGMSLSNIGNGVLS